MKALAAALVMAALALPAGAATPPTRTPGVLKVALAMPSAGCIFQNPDPRRDRLPADVPPSAGALVDRAGLKGHRIGGAVISATHANFIVNEGGATAADVRALIETARAAVHERFGVQLRDEVVFLGA